MEYLDDEGWHLCQPDGVLETEDGIFVLEMKLKQNWQGYQELRGLYMPIVEFYWEAPVSGLLVCWALQHKVQDYLFTGLHAPINTLPAGTVGTWFLRV